MKFTRTEGGTPSNLIPGWHPGWLFCIKEEATPEGWQTQTPTIYRWHLALWQTDADQKNGLEPEKHVALSSSAFSEQSKSYKWVTKLIGRELAIGEIVDFEPLYPIPCMCEVSRKAGTNFVKIEEITAPMSPERLPVHATVARWHREMTGKASPGAAPRPAPSRLAPALTHAGAATPGPESDDIPF